MSFRVSPVSGINVLLRPQARQAELSPAAFRLPSQHQQPGRASESWARSLLTTRPATRAAGVPAASATFLSCPVWRPSKGSRWFATKRQRLDEYDSYEVTVHPKHVPFDFGRVPIQLQSAAELKETVAVAGRMRLANPNFWMRCSSAIKDLSGGFRVRELVSIVNAYAKAGYRDAPLFDHLAQLIALQAHDARATDLAVCLQAFARLGIPHKPLFDLIALQCIHKIEELSPRGIATVAAAYGGVSHAHPRLFNQLAVHAQGQIETFCNIELTQLLWGCSRVGYNNLKLLNCCADQLIVRVSTCTPLEALTAAEAFVSLGFYRVDLVSCLSAFFLGKVRSLPLRRLPMLLQTFTSFDKLAENPGKSIKRLDPQGSSANAALYRAALPAIARQAACFSLGELAAVDSALRSVGLTHDLLTQALQQLLPQRIAEMRPQQCVEMLQQAAARGANAEDRAVDAAIEILLGAPDGLQSLSGPTIVCLLESLKDLHCLKALAVCGSLVFGKGAFTANRRLTGAELLIAQRLLLQAFPTEEMFLAAYGEGRLTVRRQRLEASGLSEDSEAQRGRPPSEAKQSDVFTQQAANLYSCIAATATNAAADALILAVCQYRGDPGAGLWLELLMKGRVTAANPELLPALLVELSRLQVEQREAEEVTISDCGRPIKTADPNTHAVFPPLPSSAQLSRRFSRVVRYLMEEMAEDACDSSAPGASHGGMEKDGGLMGGPYAVFLFSRISNTAAATAAKVLRHHPNLEVARRYAEQLCGLVCWRLSRASPPTEIAPAEEGGNFTRRQEAKYLARLLQSLSALGAEVSPELLQHLAPRLRGLGGGDILAVLRLLPSQSLDANLRHQLARAVNLRFRDLRSWKKLSQLREVCMELQLDVEDDILQLEAAFPRHPSADIEEDIPTLADAIRCVNEDKSSDKTAEATRADSVGSYRHLTGMQYT